ncbi:MAG: MFS transporter [Chloroflexi bacterium]|nr:MFS transporter [Chloroflexota bacterium]
MSETQRSPVAAASLSTGLTGVSLILIGSMLPHIVEAFALGEMQTGLLTGAPGFGYLVGVLLAGFLGDRLGYLHFWRLGGLMGVLAFTGLALAPTFGVALAAAIALGMVPGFFDGSINPLFVRLLGDKSAAILNRVHAFFGAGVIGGPLVIAFLMARGLLWRWIFGLVAVLAGVVLVAALRVPAPPKQERQPISLWQVLRAGWFWRGVVASAMYGGLEVIMLSWTALYLVKVRGATTELAALPIALFGAMLLIGRLASARMVQRIGASRLIVAGALVAVLGFGLLVVLPGMIWPWVAVALAGIGLSPILLTVFADASHRAVGLEGAVSSLVSASSGMGKWLLPLAIGSLAHRGRLDIGILLAVPCALILAGAYFSGALREPAISSPEGEPPRGRCSASGNKPGNASRF